jgi:hypothetical protein
MLVETLNRFAAQRNVNFLFADNIGTVEEAYSMDQGTKFLAFASIVIIALILQVALVIFDNNASPAQTAIDFAQAYYKLDKSMGQYLCSQAAGADGVDAYLYQVAQEAKAMGFKQNYMKTALAHVEAQTEMEDENTAIVRIKAQRSRYLNPVFGAVAKIFFLTETYEVDKTFKVVKEDGQWKVCGTPLLLVER